VTFSTFVFAAGAPFAELSEAELAVVAPPLSLLQPLAKSRRTTATPSFENESIDVILRMRFEPGSGRM
jgi:hypothetical protein